MSEITDRLHDFVEYAKLLKGDEKGEAQVFCDRLFKGFGHSGYKEAGAVLESRVRVKGEEMKWKTRFVDLIWKPRLLLEMKKRGENLQRHYRQAFDYWIHAVPDRPRYVALCNFDEFWIYDFDKQIDTPVDKIPLDDLPRRYTALNFLFPDDPKPIFGLDREGVTREAADQVAEVFNSIVRRGEDREVAQRFILQTVVAMFAEDMDLLPRGLVAELINDCKGGASSYDLFGALFRQMNTLEPAQAGRFVRVPYFNGGLYGTYAPVEMSYRELGLIGEAAAKDWSLVNPAIFGTLFQGSMDAEARHAYGAHFTAEADILRTVQPTIVRPWQERIAAAQTARELINLRKEMLAYRVLDPACGSGNFLYVAYRELVRLEISLLQRLKEKTTTFERKVTLSLISPRQFYGIDRDAFGIELAKVTLMLAKKLAFDEAIATLDREQTDLDLHEDHALPLDNLDANFNCGDALFADWPQVDAIIGNPPYQSKNKMQQEFGRAYMNTLRRRYPKIPGRADYCVYWFRRAQDHLSPGQRAGLVGTNTIRQNYSRQGGLDYIIEQGSTITEAVSTQVWSGEADVHVSIVNWVRGPEAGKKRLMRQLGDHRDSPWEVRDLDVINSALSYEVDLSAARPLRANVESGGCYQGQTHGHEGFLLTPAEAEVEIARQAAAREVLFPFLNSDDLLTEKRGLPSRYVIDFQPRDSLEARAYKSLFDLVEKKVLPDRQAAAAEETERNRQAQEHDGSARVNHHHANFLRRWWLLSYPRGELISALTDIDRYIACSQVMKRPVFEFISSAIRPNAALIAFPFDDDYSFGILQSQVHWVWIVNRGSTHNARPRYTSNTIFDTFPWPQAPIVRDARAVADAGIALRELRRDLMKRHKMSYRELYRTIDGPGAHPLKDAQAELDAAVRAAYAMSGKADPLAFLLEMNLALAKEEDSGKSIVGPGLPANIPNPSRFVTRDCVSMP